MSTGQIVDEAALHEALGATRFLLFKHSHRCPTSHRAMREYETFVAAHPDVPTGWINVVKQRAWSQVVAAETGVVHESPQALWIRDGAVAWHASHHDITVARLARAMTDDVGREVAG